MDQKSFSVLLSFPQSDPFAGGTICGTVLSAAKPTAANVIRASPKTNFFMKTSHLPIRESSPQKSVGFYQKRRICKRDHELCCVTMRRVRVQKRHRGRWWTGGSRGGALSGARWTHGHTFRKAPQSGRSGG